jgi:hypothetical protein
VLSTADEAVYAGTTSDAARLGYTDLIVALAAHRVDVITFYSDTSYLR